MPKNLWNQINQPYQKNGGFFRNIFHKNQTFGSENRKKYFLFIFWPRLDDKVPCNFTSFFNRLRRSFSGTAKLNYTLDKKVYVVLEEDGTEVDEEEYFQTLPSNTLLMLLYVGDRWSPYGAPFTWVGFFFVVEIFFHDTDDFFGIYCSVQFHEFLSKIRLTLST